MSARDWLLAQHAARLAEAKEIVALVRNTRYVSVLRRAVTAKRNAHALGGSRGERQEAL